VAFWRRRRRTAEASYVPYVPRHSCWAQPAVPPAEPAAPAEPPDPAVRLGFADGTEIELDGAHPSAVALRTVADVIARELG
jgi:hypothetical protein